MNFLRNLLNGQRHLTMRTLPKIGPVAETHHVNGNSLFEFPDNTQSITFGLGCFWGAERRFWEQKGVWSTQAGYAGGGYPNPTYEETCKGASMKNQHAEVVRVVFNPSEVEVCFPTSSVFNRFASWKAWFKSSGKLTIQLRVIGRVMTEAPSTAALFTPTLKKILPLPAPPATFTKSNLKNQTSTLS